MKQPSLTLRISDYDRLTALWEAAGLPYKPNGRDSREAFDRQLSNGTQAVFGLEDDNGRLIGAVMPTHDGRKGWINRLAVHPDHRRQGIATQLIAAAEEWLTEQGIEIYAALVEPGNDTSVTVFKRAGYSDWPGIHYVSKRLRPDV